jgi:two-component system KDP operon response regulator KdpE
MLPRLQGTEKGMPARILIVDDEPDMASLLDAALKAEGYEVESALNAREGLQKAFNFQPDLILLDVMMPGMDGWEALGRIREFSNVPVVMLTALQGEDRVVQGLDIGADDYITKPFRIQELKARIRAALRRASLPPAAENQLLFFNGGQVVIDPSSHLITVRGSMVDLTPTEYRLLLYLASNAGRVLTYGQILDQVWGPGYEDSLTNVKVFIRQLRRKIEVDPGQPQYILTQRGVGYYFAKV